MSILNKVYAEQQGLNQNLLSSPVESQPTYSTFVKNALTQQPNVLVKGDNGYSMIDGATGGVSSPSDSYLESLGLENVIEDGGMGWGNIFKDKYMLGNISGLAGTLMQAAALPSMLENAKLQNKSLKFNLDTAKQEQARRNKNIESFNNVNTSAFV